VLDGGDPFESRAMRGNRILRRYAARRCIGRGLILAQTPGSPGERRPARAVKVLSF
jgi:hypothetical protein